ncbi:thioredoxin-dependent thiol peroxidase [soil metagenome]
MSFFGLFEKGSPLTVGALAPVLDAVDQNGSVVHFAELYARSLVLIYFYPRASTPGCTAQACSLRDSFAQISARGLEILGVSADRPEAQKKFQDSYELPFPLIADYDGKVAEAFGVTRILGFTARQSFLIKDGRVAWVSLRAKTRDHAAEVQSAVDALLS